MSLMLMSALIAMDTMIVATAIPSIVKDLGGFALFPWVFSAYLLTQAVTIPIYGKLADLYGRKPIMLFGIVLFLIGSMFCGISWNMLSLILFRGLQGLGAGALRTTAFTVVGDLYSVEERARIQGYLSSVWGISAIISPAIGGLLVQYATWHWIFFLNLPLGLIGFWMIRHYLKEAVEKKTHYLDIRGALLLTMGLSLLILGLLQGGVSWPWLSIPTLLIFASSVGSLLLLLWLENRVPEPIIPPRVLTHRMLLGANLGGMMIGMLVIGMGTFLPTFVQGVLGESPLVAGFTLTTMSLGWPLASTFSGRFYLRMGFRNTALLGMCVSLGAAYLLFMLTPASSPWQVALASFVMGLGFGLGSPSLLVGVQSIVEWQKRGVVTSTHIFMRMIGSVVGVAVYGSILNTTLVRWFQDLPPDAPSSLQPTLDSVNQVLGQAESMLPEVERFLREGLFMAIHHIFLTLMLGVLLVFVFLLLMPGKTEKIKF